MDTKIYRDPRIKVRISTDPMGSWLIEPLNKKLNRALIEHCKELSPAGCSPWTGSLYVQEDWRQDEIARDLSMSKTELSWISSGWAVTKLMDEDLFLNRVGYDAHLVDWR